MKFVLGLTLAFLLSIVTARAGVPHDWEVTRPKPKPHPVVYSQDELDGNFVALLRYGDLAAARRWAKRGANVNQRNKHDQTLLIEFAQQGDLKRVKLLLALKADVNALDNESANALLVLLQERAPSVKVAQALIKAGINPNASDKTGMTALAYAARGGNLEICRLLVEVPGIDLRGANAPRVNPNKLPTRNLPIWFAASSGYQEIVALLLAKDPTLALDETSYSKETILIAATRGCFAETVNTILDTPIPEATRRLFAYIDRRDENFMTATMYAARNCCLSTGNMTLAVLLAHGPDLTMRAKPYIYGNFFGVYRQERDARFFADDAACAANVFTLDAALAAQGAQSAQAEGAATK